MLGRVTEPLAAAETRIDRWLTAVRLVKTRPLATRLCEGGHVLVNGSPAKPSTKVRVGDRVEALIAERERVVEVVRPIESRVGAPVAATCYVDHSPPTIVREVRPGIMAVRGEGRPSKRLRRELDRLRRAGE
jgi:ribosome-associated heat shock protein Hsp15